jgi:hypothetical protein
MVVHGHVLDLQPEAAGMLEHFAAMLLDAAAGDEPRRPIRSSTGSSQRRGMPFGITSGSTP